MARVYDLFIQGGPLMYPLLGLSLLTTICTLEQACFWVPLLRQENMVVQQVLEAAASNDWEKALARAKQAQSSPIGRFLMAPLKLKRPKPESFRLALEAAGDKEFARMRKSNKLLETVIALAPLLGLLGTVTGLIVTFTNLKIGSGLSPSDTTKAAGGIGQALICTAAGMIVAIIALIFFRTFNALQATQIDYFAEVGSELELLYRENWDHN